MRRLNADSRTADVTDVTISRIDARLDALETSIATVQTDVSTLQSQVRYALGLADLSSGTVDVSIVGLSGSEIVQLTHKDFNGGTPGFLSFVITADTLTINSSDVADKSTVAYCVCLP